MLVAQAVRSLPQINAKVPALPRRDRQLSEQKPKSIVKRVLVVLMDLVTLQFLLVVALPMVHVVWRIEFNFIQETKQVALISALTLQCERIVVSDIPLETSGKTNHAA